MTDVLEEDARALLAREGLEDAAVERLPGDASARRYARVSGAGRLLMEDRTDGVGFDAFLRLSDHLSGLGLSAPRVQAADPAGLAVIEDFGTDTYGRLLGAGHDERALYELAIDALLHLHAHPRAAEVSVPDYTQAQMLDEVSRFSHWFVQVFAPDKDVAAFDAGFTELWRAALARLEAAPRTLCLLDFHIDNLMLLPGRPGVQACGLLDFQDAVIGPGEYDLMSLLQDARRDLAPGLEEAMLARYVAGAPAALGGEAAILGRYHLMAAQRHTRLVGQFPRLWKRDGKPWYLQFMPRVMRQMTQALEDARLDDIAAYLDAELPGWRDAGPQLAAMAPKDTR